MLRGSRWLGALLLAAATVLLAAPTASAAPSITVTTVQDVSSGPGDTGDCLTTDQSCSLRQAVAAANSDSSIDEISLPAGTYQLTQPTELDIQSTVDLVGAGADTTEA